MRDNEWRSCFFFLLKTLVNGERACGVLMRKRENGRWIYRYPTSEEAESYSAAEIW